ncbi:hypothetical protein CPB83DRAFT_864350 [Crepidotus variabilis]|uniref:Uncharacterized protein n=1 Tax=Crepidotus variabilis TaxID=179855 RepID=A0A9P6JIW5_9AGAR|nr:hypothetical protein CPB83DRAFT_864350 [Crepidotus variabilis]
MLTTATILVIRIFSLFLNPRFVPWVSWEATHANLSQVEIVTSTIGIRASLFEWWSVFAVSVIFVILAYLLGEETRDVGQWIRVQGRKKRSPLGIRKLVLPLSQPRGPSPQEMVAVPVSRSASLSKPQARPLTLELPSGWDDMLDIKTPKFKTSFKSLLSPRPPSPTCTSPTPSTYSTADEDRVFTASTLSYLGSSTAKSLGISSLPSPPPPPPAAKIPSPAPSALPQRPEIMIQIPPVPTSPPPAPPIALVRSRSRESERSRNPERPGTNAETLSTVLDASWPLPPNSPVPSLVPSRHAGRTRSRSGSVIRSGSGSGSPTSSVEEGPSFGYPLYPAVTPPHLRSRPFEGSSITSVSDISVSPTPSPIKPLKSILKRPSIKSLRRSWSKESLGQGQGQVTADFIHMTVVQETV